MSIKGRDIVLGDAVQFTTSGSDWVNVALGSPHHGLSWVQMDMTDS